MTLISEIVCISLTALKESTERGIKALWKLIINYLNEGERYQTQYHGTQRTRRNHQYFLGKKQDL